MAVNFTRYQAPVPAGAIGTGSAWQNGRVAGGVAPGGQPRLDTPKAYRCGKCGAEPGQSCRRWVSGAYRDGDGGGGYWRTLKSLHPGRRPGRASVPD